MRDLPIYVVLTPVLPVFGQFRDDSVGASLLRVQAVRSFTVWVQKAEGIARNDVSRADDIGRIQESDCIRVV